MRVPALATLLLACTAAAAAASAAATSAPVVAWSTSPAGSSLEAAAALLPERHGFRAPAADDAAATPTLVDVLRGYQARAPAFTLAVVADTLSRAELSAASLRWVKDRYDAAPASETVARVSPSAPLDPAALPEALVYDGPVAEAAQAVARFVREDPTTTMIVVKVGASISDSATASAVQRLVESMDTLFSGPGLVVVSGAAADAAPLDIDGVLLSAQKASAPTTSARAGARRILQAAATTVGATKFTGTRNSPAIMAGTLVGFMLLFFLSIAVSCLSSIDSSPMMFTQPPGPKDGDPQFAGTPKEGTRYYPFRNQPFKEH